MSAKEANGLMFCQAVGLPQSAADRASVPLADGRQSKAQNAQSGHESVIPQRKFQKNTIEELSRKRLRRKIARKNNMPQMTRKEKHALIKAKLEKHLEATHSQEIKELKGAELAAKRKTVFFWKKWRNTALTSLRLLQGSTRLCWGQKSSLTQALNYLST